MNHVTNLGVFLLISLASLIICFSIYMDHAKKEAAVSDELKKVKGVKYEALIIHGKDTTRGTVSCMPHHAGDSLKNHICFFYQADSTTIKVYAKEM